MMEDVIAFQAAPAGSAESAALGLKLVENMTSNLLFIGTVKGQQPIYHSNALKNFTQFKTASYAYYRTYPYRAAQWFFSE
jgi:peptide/nickel transport system substrate-binding protein